MFRGEGSKYVKNLFIQLFIITYVSSSARGLLICRHPRLDHAKQNLVISGGSFRKPLC